MFVNGDECFEYGRVDGVYFFGMVELDFGYVSVDVE